MITTTNNYNHISDNHCQSIHKDTIISIYSYLNISNGEILLYDSNMYPNMVKFYATTQEPNNFNIFFYKTHLKKVTMSRTFYKNYH